MRWSYKLARVAGIDVRVHATFLLLLAFVAFQGYAGTGTARGALASAGAILLVFFIVVLHEYGHAFAARRYGIPTADITLLPIGGVARLTRMPREPRQELVIALAGPAVNVVLAALLWTYLRVAGASGGDAMAPADARFFGEGLARQLLTVNVWLAGFNLIPAFPMDGGRVLRALLVMRTGDYAKSTARAAAIGRAVALVLGFIGLTNPNYRTLVLVALFVWVSAAGEAGAVQESSALSGVPLERVMMTDVRTLAPTDALGHAAELVLAGPQHDFPVVDGVGQVVGLLTRADLIRALTAGGVNAPVADAMRRDFAVAEPGERVEDALARLAPGAESLPVVRGRTLLGVLTRENVGEYLMIRDALRGRRPAPRPPCPTPSRSRAAWRAGCRGCC
jgi:Zn-dependent protease/CBS domain-containing protein